MLREIRIQNLGVIDDVVLELSAGLNVVTGETGAGKTMVVSALAPCCRCRRRCAGRPDPCQNRFGGGSFEGLCRWTDRAGERVGGAR